MKIAKEGLLFIIPFSILALLFLILEFWIFFVILSLITFCLCFFFRDPKRKIPKKNNAILSPADGKIVKIQTLESHQSLPSPTTIISIFLSLLDVHITRAPLSGLVEKIEFHSGKYFSAYKEEASLKNKSNSIYMKSDGRNILIRQIVGYAARRLKCYVSRNEKIEKGQKIGLMYFGSRVEVFLPPGIQLKIRLNQKVIAGETEIAEIEDGKS